MRAKKEIYLRLIDARQVCYQCDKRAEYWWLPELGALVVPMCPDHFDKYCDEMLEEPISEPLYITREEAETLRSEVEEEVEADTMEVNAEF